MRVELVSAERLNSAQAAEVLVNIDLDAFKESSLWARLTTKNSARLNGPEYFFKPLSDMAYHCKYQLVSGILEVQSLGQSEPESIPVFFWALEKSEDDFTDDTLEYSYKYPVVEADKPYELVRQAVMIRNAYFKGFSDRSDEVRGFMAGLLGVSDDDLDRSLGFGDDED